MTVLLIIFVLASSGRWEFSNIEYINAINAREYCEHLAASAWDSQTRVFCMDDEGLEI